MNWLKKISQKPMPLPVNYTHDDEVDFGASKIRDIMTYETADQLNLQYPNMKYLGSGRDGITYRTSSGSIVKFTNDLKEAETATIVYNNPLDWVVPILSPPKQIQQDLQDQYRPNETSLWAIEMKELKIPTTDERRLINWLTFRCDTEKFHSLNQAVDVFGQDIDQKTLSNIYNQTKHIIESNKNTLWLTDIHGGNVGWDEDRKLKVFDFGG